MSENQNVKVKIEKKPNCQVTLEVVASKQIIDEANKRAIKDAAKEISVPGFRKGKAPKEIILKQNPALFKQKRIGKNGRVFMLLKFRSMYQDAEERKSELMAQNEMEGLMFKMENDPRVTPVGRFLRKTSLDEFPQFLNVLKGEMSLVGTRPPTPDEVADYDFSHRRKISAKPGITGLWQVSGRNKVKDFEKVVELDCIYLDRWRFIDDIKILLRTIYVVILRKGAK